MELAELRNQYIEGIYQTKALLIKEEPFTLQSGKKSHIYLNHRNFLSDNVYLSLIATIYHQLANCVGEDYMLGAVDSIMSPVIVGAMASLFHRDYVIVKRKPLTHGTQEFIYGQLKNKVVLIDDMTSTGETLIDAAQKIRAQGGVVSRAIISAYRDADALENLEHHGIKTLAIASFDEIIASLYPQLTSAEKSIIENQPLIMD